MKIIKIILGFVVIGISVYGLITKDFSYEPISNLLFGIFLTIFGIEEFKKVQTRGMILMPLAGLFIVMGLLSLNKLV